MLMLGGNTVKQRNPGFKKLIQDAKTRIKEIELETLQARLDAGATLIDVRETSEFDEQHIPEAMHLSKGVIEVKIESTISDKDQEIILYCGGGSRSALAADNLQKMGYNNVYSLAGGFRGWSESNAS